MTSICLVRHGETDWNKAGRIQGTTDTILNETGKKQANAARKTLEQYSWDLIITSPLERTKQTATIINTHMQLPILEMDDFKERNYGDAEGITIKELEKKLHGTRTYPNQESREAVTQRVMQGIQQVLKKFPNKKVLLISHGGVINAILAHLSNGDIGSGKTKLINTCLSNITHDGKAWTVNDYNQVGHLAGWR